MRRLRIIVALLLAALWAPITAHCDVEQLTDLGFLACGSHGETGGCDSSPRPDDCQEDGCALIEDGLYKTESDSSPLNQPDWRPVFAFGKLSGPVHTERDLTVQTSITGADPANRIPWQTTFRAVPQPRAPSVES